MVCCRLELRRRARKGFGEEDAVVKGMFRPWNPMKQEIEIWLETKQLEFAQKDNKGSRYTPCQYLQRYVFTDLHEAYFCFFQSYYKSGY
jgi:hypothetical protein